MSRRKQNHYDDNYDSDDIDDTETLISRNKPLNRRVKSAPARKPKKISSSRRPGSPLKGKIRTGKDLWMNAIKKRQTLGLTNGRHPDSPRHKTPIEYFVDTLRKTGSGISSESTMNSLTGLKKNNDLNLAYLSTSHYMRQAAGTEKPKRFYDDPTGKPMAGTPAYKSQEEYYDQILELKKVVSSLNQDHTTMKAKVRRLEEDNMKKEKEIDVLLHPEKSEDLRRTMGDRKPDTGAVIHSLKQKILKLEMQLRDKESTHTKLTSELKTTKVDEMKVQMEVLYQEVMRLQNSRDSGIDKSSTSRSVKDSGPKLKALNVTVLRLSKTNEQLQAENKGLKEDLEKALEDTDDKGYVKREYDDMNKRQLMTSIAKLEQRATRAERRLETDNNSLLSLDSRRSEVQGKISLHGTVEERLHQLDQRETELLDEVETLKRKIKRLTTDRNRKKSELDMMVGTPRQKSPPTPSSRSRRPTSTDSGRDSRIDNFSKKHAATKLQRQWREHKEKKNQEDEAAYTIQSALRGHHQRRQQLSRYTRGGDDDDDDDDMESSAGSDDAVFMIQSSLRGHKSRKERIRRMRHSSTGDDDDDDENYRGYANRKISSGGRRPTSAQSRSSSTRKTTYASYGSHKSSVDDDDDIMF